MKLVRDILPSSGKLIVAVNLKSERDFVSVMELYTLADAILLDSADPEGGRVGGTGMNIDWGVGAAFVRECPIPVILAGGLDGTNVEEAVRTVRPYAVDANSRLKDSDGSIDLCLAREYVKMAKKN